MNSWAACPSYVLSRQNELKWEKHLMTLVPLFQWLVLKASHGPLPRGYWCSSLCSGQSGCCAGAPPWDEDYHPAPAKTWAPWEVWKVTLITNIVSPEMTHWGQIPLLWYSQNNNNKKKYILKIIMRRHSANLRVILPNNFKIVRVTKDSSLENRIG